MHAGIRDSYKQLRGKGDKDFEGFESRESFACGCEWKINELFVDHFIDFVAYENSHTLSSTA